MLDQAVGPNVIKRLLAGLDAFLERNAADGWTVARGLPRASGGIAMVLPQSEIRAAASWTGATITSGATSVPKGYAAGQVQDA